MRKRKFEFEPYKGFNTRFQCPRCKNRKRTFVRYIDSETGEYVHPLVGKCDREIKCGYWYTAYQYFKDNNVTTKTPWSIISTGWKAVCNPKPISFIPNDIFKASLNQQKFEKNYLVQFLSMLFGVDVASLLISRYFIGTSKHWKGATVFWQIDKGGKIRTGKIMLYSPTTGKRVKEPFNHVDWVHTALKLPEFELRQCFFGEHLLADKEKNVAIVESEKTAIIASVAFPQFIWLASGGVNNLKRERFNSLKGRRVVIFPDCDSYDKWTSKVAEIGSDMNITISDFLLHRATDSQIENGYDLADYIIETMLTQKVI